MVKQPWCSGKQQCFSIFFQPKGQIRTPSLHPEIVNQRVSPLPSENGRHLLSPCQHCLARSGQWAEVVSLAFPGLPRLWFPVGSQGTHSQFPGLVCCLDILSPQPLPPRFPSKNLLPRPVQMFPPSQSSSGDIHCAVAASRTSL